MRAMTDAFARMTRDPDIVREGEPHGEETKEDPANSLVVAHAVPPLSIAGGAHQATPATALLLREAGGLDALRRFTHLFYKKAFADAHIDQFIRSHDDPHGERFATWIAEKFGLGTPWSDERAVRPTCPLSLGARRRSGGGAGAAVRSVVVEVHDRSAAHFAAWHSPKREPEKWGEHFKLDDCRVWMRLHFWALREAGLFESAPAFAEYYTKFIGHFVRVYERAAPAFAREAARWSADAANVERYRANGNAMDDVIGVPFGRALASLPREEQGGDGWPYV